MEKARQHPALTAGLAALGLSIAAPVAAEPLALPSGLMIERLDVIFDAELQTGRFRFLAPQIAAPGFDLDGLAVDFDHLCDTVARPAMRSERPFWDQVVISLSSAPIPFGQSDPAVVQAFEGYLLGAEGCIWQQF